MAVTDAIDDIHRKADIVDLVGRHVSMRRSGKKLVGLCPFHGEKTASFYVDPIRQRFHCFGCNERGDAIDFVQKIEGVTFQEAIRILGARYAIALPKQTKKQVEEAAESERLRGVGLQINRLAADQYRLTLEDAPTGAEGRKYKDARGITDATAETMQLGYAPHQDEGGWASLAEAIREAGLPLPVAEKLGLVSKSERTGKFYDRFRGRLMFPILSASGSVLGFSGRIVPAFSTEGESKVSKYINSPESFLYKKGTSLYGIHTAHRKISESRRVIVVEGNVDVVSLHQQGWTETVAPLGTALTQHQCAALRRYADIAVLILDGDAAGLKATRKAIRTLMTEGLEARVVHMEPGDDPDSVPPERLARMIEKAVPGIEWRLREMVTHGAVESIEAKGRALDSLAPLMRLVASRADLDAYARLAGDILQLPLRQILAAVQGQQPSYPSEAPPASESQHPEFLASEVELTGILVDNPRMLAKICQSGNIGLVSHHVLRRVLSAAVSGEQPCEGELLKDVEPKSRGHLQRAVFGSERVSASESELSSAIMECKASGLARELDGVSASVIAARAGESVSSMRKRMARNKTDVARKLALLR